MGYYTDFATALGSMTVTGVTKKVTSPPTQINTAQLPMLYVRLPTGANTVAVLSGGMGLKQAGCEVVILVEPILQSTAPVNFALCLSLMDALEAALTTLVADGDINEWSIRQDVEATSESTAYWALIATVQGSG